MTWEEMETMIEALTQYVENTDEAIEEGNEDLAEKLKTAENILERLNSQRLSVLGIDA